MTVTASKYEPRANDLYETPKWATYALMRQILLGRHDVIWEPAAGNHKMADILREHNSNVVTSDVATYKRSHSFIYDFLGSNSAPGAKADWIITNPPYGAQNRLAHKFATLALERAERVALLLTMKFDSGKSRAHLFRDNPRFVKKIVLLDRLQWFGKRDGNGSTEDHAWYVWGPPPPHTNTRAHIAWEAEKSED